MTMEGQLEIIRTFNAPRDLVFKVWTEAAHLIKWWGPKGSIIHVANQELRPQGLFHYNMTHPDGNEMWAKFIYQEIAAPEKLVFLNCFSDADGRTVPAPFGPEFADFPLEVQITVLFEEQGGQTTVRLIADPHMATPAQQAFFRGMFDSMQQGYRGTFDQLEEYLQEPH
ncbi:SRPBCC family protein [Paenibacillus sp. strain BS8-2]